MQQILPVGSPISDTLPVVFLPCPAKEVDSFVKQDQSIGDVGK